MITDTEVRSVLDELIRKLPARRREATARLVQNQLDYFQRCSEEDGGTNWGHNGASNWQDALRIFGKEWVPRFLASLVHQMGKTHLFNLLRFEIAKAPVEQITFAHVHHETEKDGTSLFSLRFQNVERRMQPRKGPRIDWGEDMLCDWDGSRRRFIQEELWPVWCMEVFASLERDMLRDMAETARRHGYALTSKEEFLKTVERESERLHYDSETGPGNKLLVNNTVAVDLPLTDKTYDPHTYDPHNYGLQRVGLLDGRWEVYSDPFFQEHEAMVWHYTDETAHAGMLTMLQNFTLPGHMDSTRIRYTKLVTNDRFFRLLRIQ